MRRTQHVAYQMMLASKYHPRNHKWYLDSTPGRAANTASRASLLGGFSSKLSRLERRPGAEGQPRRRPPPQRAQPTRAKTPLLLSIFVQFLAQALPLG